MLKTGKSKENKKKSTMIEDSFSDSEKENKDLKENHKKDEIKGKKSGARINKILLKKNELKLQKLVLENFKSFEGRHEVGYFLNFSVVLGPNGSGKSNIIDAICFALGMKTISLRTKNLRDLVYKRDSDEESKRASFVELVFLKDGEEISFKRAITQKGGSEFYFNESKLSGEDYLKKLEKFEIPSKARYFILVQGAIDSILSKKNDLTETIEFLSSSYEHKEDYEKVKNEIKLINEEMNKLSSEMLSIKDDRNKVKSQIENEEKYTELIKKLDLTLNKIYLYKLAEMDSLILTNQEKLKENEESMRLSHDEKKSLIDFIKSSELEVRKFERQNEDDINYRNLRKKMEEISNQVNQTKENLKLSESLIFGKISKLNQYRADKKKKDEKKNILISQIRSFETQIDEIKKIIDSNSDLSVKSNKLDKSQIEAYRAYNQNFESEGFELRREYDKLLHSRNEVNESKSLMEKAYFKLDNERNVLEKEAVSCQEKLDTEVSNKGKLDLLNISLKSELAGKEEERIKLDLQWQETHKLLSENIDKLSQYENDNFENAKRRKISELMNKSSLVYGFLYELITPLQKKFELPIKVSLLKYLNYLVVENEDTAKLCSEFLKSKEISADVLVLANIPEKENDESIRLRLGNLGNLVVDLIDCKKRGLKNAINFFLKDLVICYEKENLSKIKAKGFNSVILLDGTLYKKGTIRGGVYRNLEQYSFNYKSGAEDTVEKLKKEVESLTKKLASIEEKLNAYKDSISLKSTILANEGGLEIHSKNIALHKESLTKLRDSIAFKDKEIKSISLKLESLKQSYSEISEQIAELTNKRSQLKESIFKSFLTKFNLPLRALKDFEPFSISEMKRKSEELKSLEEKVFKLNSQIKIIEDSDELITKLETNLEEEKEKKKKIESELSNLLTLLDSIQKEWQNSHKIKADEFNKIQNLKEEIKNKQSDLEKIDKRIRGLLKSKIEYEHTIVNSIENKRTIISESKLNIDEYMKDLNNIIQSLSVFISFSVDIEKYIVATEEKLGKTNLVIDFDLIETKKKISESSPEGHKEKVEKLKAKFNELMKELEKYVKLCSLNDSESNKLKDREEELARKKKQTSLQVQNLVNELDAKKEEFENIRRQRKTKFVSFFEDLSSKLSQTYKELTTPPDSLSPGGSAYIYNTNEDEPYLGTVCYLPTPPGKRVVYDFDQLSGGEKTIAILSLVISLQSICHTPFIVLDEVDSYLDPEHEAILERLFKAQNKNFQIILVTHKSSIYRSAESLIGTYFNKQKFSSVPLSIDMTKIY